MTSVPVRARQEFVSLSRFPPPVVFLSTPPPPVLCGYGPPTTPVNAPVGGHPGPPFSVLIQPQSLVCGVGFKRVFPPPPLVVPKIFWGPYSFPGGTVPDDSRRLWSARPLSHKGESLFRHFHLTVLGLFIFAGQFKQVTLPHARLRPVFFSPQMVPIFPLEKRVAPPRPEVPGRRISAVFPLFGRMLPTIAMCGSADQPFFFPRRTPPGD